MEQVGERLVQGETGKGVCLCEQVLACPPTLYPPCLSSQAGIAWGFCG